MYKPRLITAPATQPVSLDEAKQFLNILHDDDNVLLTAFITAATQYLDGYSGVLGRAILLQTWEMPFDRFPAGRCGLSLPFGGVTGIVSLQWKDSQGVDHSVDASDCVLETLTTGQVVSLKQGSVWPSTGQSIRLIFEAGVLSAAQVPEIIKTTIKWMVADFYERRGSSSADGSDFASTNPAFQSLVQLCRQYSF